jgi:hypothetical protein
MRAGPVASCKPFLAESDNWCSNPGPTFKREVVTGHADAQSPSGGHLALAALPVVRPVLGATMRAAHDPALTLGALHLRAHSHGDQDHRTGRSALPGDAHRRHGGGLRSLTCRMGKSDKRQTRGAGRGEAFGSLLFRR